MTRVGVLGVGSCADIRWFLFTMLGRSVGQPRCGFPPPPSPIVCHIRALGSLRDELRCRIVTKGESDLRVGVEDTIPIYGCRGTGDDGLR